MQSIIKNILNSVSKQWSARYIVYICNEITNLIPSSPFELNQKRTFTESSLMANIQNTGQGLYHKSEDDIVIKYDIRVDAATDIKQVLLKHGDEIIFQSKRYRVSSIDNLSATGHVIYYCNLVKRV